MKQDNIIRDAIDESLSGVHFSQRDMQRVLLRTRRTNVQSRQKSKPRRLKFALVMGTLTLLIAPLAAFTLRAPNMLAIHAAPGDPIITAQQPDDPHADHIVSPVASGYTAAESEAIRIARTCFETVCDTSIFSFEEYAVSVTRDSDAEYTVTMDSIYGNGCSFSVTVSLASHSMVRHSTPQLATVPAYQNTDAPEIKAWHEKYGSHLLTWPQDAQAEFSRRYEGGMLRAASPGELSAKEAAALACETLRKQLSAEDALHGYPLLYAERAYKDGAARYVVSVFSEIITDNNMPEPLGTVTFKADGSDVTFTLQ